MQHMRLKLAIAGLVLLGAVGYLAFAGLREGWVYHVEVDQYVQNADLQQQRVRLVGRVSPQDLQMSPAKMTAHFAIVGASGKTVRVAYRGTIPDLFKADSEVVVEGKRDVTGLFQADVLMTKCASKYESDQHSAHDSKQG